MPKNARVNDIWFILYFAWQFKINSFRFSLTGNTQCTSSPSKNWLSAISQKLCSELQTMVLISMLLFLLFILTSRATASVLTVNGYSNPCSYHLNEFDMTIEMAIPIKTFVNIIKALKFYTIISVSESAYLIKPI